MNIISTDTRAIHNNYIIIKASDIQNILENYELYKYFKISLQMHIIISRNENNGKNLHILL